MHPLINFSRLLVRRSPRHSALFIGVSIHLAVLHPFIDVFEDPNPAPTSGAVSQTFVSSASTLVIQVPTSTTTVTVGAATIVIAPGGTPVGGPVPSGVTQPGAVAPVWGTFSS